MLRPILGEIYVVFDIT